MIKQPTTKKLSDKKVKSAIDSEGNPYQKLFPDEQFYQYPHYPNIFVSQYANILLTSSKIPRLAKPYFNPESGYTSIILSKKGKRKIHYLHRMVAEVWVRKPDFVLPIPLEVHHRRR